jgi:hypothetical protein
VVVGSLVYDVYLPPVLVHAAKPEGLAVRSHCEDIPKRGERASPDGVGFLQGRQARQSRKGIDRRHVAIRILWIEWRVLEGSQNYDERSDE